MFNAATWAIIAAVSVSAHICRFIFWLDSPKRS